MSQYERIVSYLYRYEHGEKKENSGYAKVERRENECRISLQMKSSMPVKEAKAYFYIQRPSGIQTIEIGSMQLGRNEMRLKQRTETGNLFGTGIRYEEADGIFIYAGVEVCYATTWKNDYFYQGDWRQGESIKPQPLEENRDVTEEPTEEVQEPVAENDIMTEAKVIGSDETEEHVIREEMEEKQAAQEEGLQGCVPEEGEAEDLNMVHDIPNQNADQKASEHEVKECELSEQELKMQSVCEECPLKRETIPRKYGERILKTLPTMYPFKDTERGCCVKMELQDIGCLPMRFWSLSGNRFLLHGYYCYRHLLFLRGEQGEYLLGVPGIYNEKEFKNSMKYGFNIFRQIGEEKRQGAFGYWLMKLE